ncbi:TonB-dependent receptor domain-containing protein [Sphingomonas soli]|uniref:TonB-dependent receptor domain-containing protein n=1 Tax=Sphingomonas soli TaxID=266127 RepID=UPI000833603E|nr:TonB-dependent receptor [Sphingomonas soli]
MKQKIAFASLLIGTGTLVSPEALAQVAAQAAATDPTQVSTQDKGASPDVSAPGFDPDAGSEIVVVGHNIPDVVRATPQVVSVLSTEDIARTGEGDIAGALTRVTGMSVVGNGFVFVRGLGDRYSSSLLNGSPLPSPEPLRRTVPLDIFPTSIVGSALVQKTYSANYPGEFGGGVINLTTRAVPQESFLQVGGNLAYDSATTNQFGYVYDGGRLDSLGYDTGERKVPDFIREGGLTTNVFTSRQAAQLTNAETTLLQQNDRIPVNWSADMSAGHAFDLGGVRLGLIASASLGNSFRTRDAIQQDTADPSGAVRSDFRTVLTDNRIVANGLLGLGAEFGEHRIRWTNLYIHDTLKQARLGAATVYPNSNGNQVLEQNTNWFERQLIDTQLTGEFKFNDLSVDLRGSYANTKRNAPYERFFSYRLDPVRSAYVNSLNGLGESATVAFSELDETLWSGQADLRYRFPFATLSVGYFYSDAQRSSTRFDFRYRTFNGSGLSAPASYLRPDMLLSIDSIMGACPNPTTVVEEQGCIRLFNLSNAQGAAQYDASLTIHAGYFQIESEITGGLRATAGVRYEKGDERVSTNSALFQGTRLNNGYWLPAATVTWNFASDMQLRAHASKTIARPQFRELAPQVYRDFESDRLFFGNPQLVDSKLLNFEGRYEWFFGRNERFTAAGFYKKIDNPTEQVAFFPTPDSSLQTGFSYAPSATLWGGEAEVQKFVSLEGWGGFFTSRRLLLNANYTYTKSSIQSGSQLVPSPIQNGSGVAVLVPSSQLFRDGAPLTGQSDHLVNLQVGIEDTDRLSQLTLLFSYASERVTNRGANLLPDIIERPGVRLDLVGRQGISLAGVEFELKLEARNLTGTGYREYQQFQKNAVEINRYKVGRTFSVGLGAKF